MKLISWLLVLSCVLMADPGRRDRSDWEGYPPPPTSESRRMPTWAELHGSGYKPAKEPEPCDTPEPATIAITGVGIAAIAAARALRRAIGELKAEIAELRKDKARLDWLQSNLLERHYEYIGIEMHAGSIANLTAVSDEAGAEVTAKDIRSAIDAAMEAK